MSWSDFTLSKLLQLPRQHLCMMLLINDEHKVFWRWWNKWSCYCNQLSFMSTIMKLWFWNNGVKEVIGYTFVLVFRILALIYSALFCLLYDEGYEIASNPINVMIFRWGLQVACAVITVRGAGQILKDLRSAAQLQKTRNGCTSLCKDFKTNGGNPAPALCYLGQVVLQSSLHEHNTDLSVTNLQPLKESHWTKRVLDFSQWAVSSGQGSQKYNFWHKKRKKILLGGKKEKHINRKPHSSCEPGSEGRAHEGLKLLCYLRVWKYVYAQTYYVFYCIWIYSKNSETEPFAFCEWLKSESWL